MRLLIFVLSFGQKYISEAANAENIAESIIVPFCTIEVLRGSFNQI